MSTVPPGAPIPPPPPPPQHDSPSSAPLSWEGEKMFNIYIYDYCFKRGYRKTARELLQEADIPPDSTPPINARQGLLFEWWSVFWVLFQAKSNNGGSEDALLYTQHQAATHRNSRILPPPQGPALTTQQRQGVAPGMMNGVVPNQGGQPQLPPGGPMMYGVGGTPVPQVNGVPGGSHPPTPGGVPPHGQIPQGPHPGAPQQPGFNPMTQQRPMNGPQPQQPLPPAGAPQQPNHQRPMGSHNSNLPFQSPTMAHSPNGGPGMQQQGPQGQQPGGMQQPPMGNLGGPSPLMGSMNRSGPMMPPNTNGAPPPQGMMGVPQPGGLMSQSGTPTQQFQQIANAGRPPSRTNTPQMHVPGMMQQQSPSMANRQPMSDAQVVNEFSRIPQPVLMQLRAEAELANKDINQFTVQDKRRIIQHNQLRNRPQNAIPGPSNPGMPPNQPQRGPQQPQQHQQRGKRNSTSPGEEHESLPRTDSSPPERKRPRRSPQENSTIPKPLNNMTYPQTPQQGAALPQQQGPQGQLQQPTSNNMSNMMMMGGRPIGPQGGPMQGQLMVNGHIPPPPMSMQQGQPTPPHGQMQGGMNPPNQMGHMGMMVPNSMGQNNYRVPLHQVHNMQGQNAGSPAGPDPSFNAGGSGQAPPPGGPPGFNNNRMMGPKPPQGGGIPPPANMMPPSPANAGKDAQGKDKSNVDGSPSGGGQPPNQQGVLQPQQNAPMQPNPSMPPTMPGTPASQTQQPQHSQNSIPPPPSQTPTGVPTPSPNNMLGGPNPMSALNGMEDPMTMFSTGDFSLPFDSSFDTGTLDFERDFGQWFNPEDMGLPTEMK